MWFVCLFVCQLVCRGATSAHRTSTQPRGLQVYCALHAGYCTKSMSKTFDARVTPLPYPASLPPWWLCM